MRFDVSHGERIERHRRDDHRRAPARVRSDAAAVLALQRSIGNRATVRLLQRDYEEERSDSTLPDAPVELTFDGRRLEMRGQGVDTSWAAVSGRPDASGGFDYSAERQRERGVGPIPEGEYWLDPRQLVDLEDRWFYGILYEGGWGTHRITIHPFTRTETHGRGGFFIHGGTSAGSAGCIDLTSNMASFARRLAAYKPINEGRVCGPSATPHKVRLHVRYTTVYYGRGAELREIESRIVGPPGRREYVGPGGHRVPEYP